MFGSGQQELKFLFSAHYLNMFSVVAILRSLGMKMTMPIFQPQIETTLPSGIYGSGGASLHLLAKLLNQGRRVCKRHDAPKNE
jgi:hypothetical protein